jgi:invasion protein IalB
VTSARKIRNGLAISLAALAFLTTAAGAQTQAPQPMFGPRAGKEAPAPAPEVIGKFGKWTLSCENLPKPPANDAAPDAPVVTERSCGLVQGTRSEERKGVGLSLVIVKAKQEDGKEGVMVRVMAPIGVFLPMGVALEIDGEAISRVPFTRCAPQTCMAMGSASPETLAKMKKGKIATFIIYDGPAAGVPLEIDLKGFTGALAALDKQVAAQ